MRSLFFMLIAFVVFTTSSCRRNNAQQQFEQYLERSHDMEYIVPKEDSVKLDANGNITTDDDEQMELGGDDDGLMVIPDIPKERKINMNANNYELEKVMSGR